MGHRIGEERYAADEGTTYTGRWTLVETVVTCAQRNKGPYRAKLQITPYNHTSPFIESFPTLDALFQRVADSYGGNGRIGIAHVHNAADELEFGLLGEFSGELMQRPDNFSRDVKCHKSSDFKAAEERAKQREQKPKLAD